MTHILLTHGYFLSEDEKERQIMKPYPPLGLLYLSAYLKTRDHSVEVYDSTFGTRPELVQKIRQSHRGIVGIYTKPDDSWLRPATHQRREAIRLDRHTGRPRKRKPQH